MSIFTLNLFIGFITVLCGMFIAIQASTNTVLLNNIGNAVWVGVILFSIGLVYLLMLALITQAQLNFSSMFNAPIWSYMGGIVVASYVVLITFIVPKLGVSHAIFLILFGQILASILVDHFGWFSLAVHQINGKRMTGVCFMLVGIYLARN